MTNHGCCNQTDDEEQHSIQWLLVAETQQMHGKGFPRDNRVNQHRDSACEQAKYAHDVKREYKRNSG